MKHFIIAVAAVAFFGCQSKESGAEAVPAAETATETLAQQTTTASDGVQTVDIRISGGEYQPASITVAKGQPVRLNFTRDEKPTCGDVVVFPALNIRKEIPVNQVVSIDLNPTEAGELKFVCGMDMMKGTVVVQ
ncbi:MAG TPA: cupredoxin domain-containing protein [Thermoanaerobaculia bacterium]|nr:cupredoxin domain-containing protein [Thermoanaerobaculia bacterium]